MDKERRKYGDGYIRTTSSGTIEYRFRYTDEEGRRKYKSVSGVSEDHCYERAELFLAELNRAKNYIDYSASIVSLMREAIESDYKKNYIGVKSYERNLQIVDMIAKHTIGHMPICELKEFHIEVFYDYIKSYSNYTINKITATMKNAFNIALQKGIVDTNIMTNELLRKPKSDKADKKVKGMTVEEQMRFVKALDEYKVRYGSNSYKLQYLIELYSGMRMGEINALKPEDIDFDKGYIHVCRAVVTTRNNHRFIKEATKTEAGERNVPISKSLERVLRKALDEMKDNSEGLIFYDHRNKSIISTTQVNSVFKTICKKAEVKCYGQHSLRHTFATRCIEAGVPALVLKGWLGHKDIHVTLDTYVDVFNRMEFGEMAKLDSYIDTVMGDE